MYTTMQQLMRGYILALIPSNINQTQEHQRCTVINVRLLLLKIRLNILCLLLVFNVHYKLNQLGL